MSAEFQHLLNNLHAPDPETRVAAADAIGQYEAMHDDPDGLVKSAIPHLVALLHDPNRDVRWSAAYALGAIGDAAAIPALTDVYRRADGDRGLQLVIVKSLGKINDATVVQLLHEIMKTAKTDYLRTAATHTLRRIGTPEATAALSV